jgi:hypothetical protein
MASGRQRAIAMQLTQCVEQLATEHLHDHRSGQEMRASWLDPHPIAQAPIAHQGMDVRVQVQAASPGVQREHDARLRAQVARIGEQFEQRVARGGEQCTHHRIGIEPPQNVEFVRNGEHHVPVCALDQTRAGALEPALFG